MFLAEDFKKNPGTLGLTASWGFVFVLIVLAQWVHPVPIAPGQMPDPLPVSTLTSHRFGDMTWQEVRRGEPWRLLTATFIHFGLVHLALNGLALINIGRLIEPWYRTGPLVIGGLGNLVGGGLRQVVAHARPWLAAKAGAWHLPDWVEQFLQGGPPVADIIQTGGGSTVVLGLFALAAVVGWRSKTRVGAHLQKRLVILLALTGVLGVGMYKLVDNYGHLGGAIVGGLIGFFHPPLMVYSRSKNFRRLSWAACAVLTATCVGFAIHDDLIETRQNQQRLEVNQRIILDDAVRVDLIRLYILYAQLIMRSPALAQEVDGIAVSEYLKQGPNVSRPQTFSMAELRKDQAELATVLDRLDKTHANLWPAATAEDFASLRELARLATDRPITYSDAYGFFVAWKPAVRAIVDDLARLNARAMELDRISRESR